MVKNSKVKKGIACFVLGGFLLSMDMQTALAATTMTNVDQIVTQARDIKKYEVINEVRNGNSQWADKELKGYVFPKSSNFQLKNTRVTTIGDARVDYQGDTVYIGHAVLTNNSSTEQTLVTQSFSETVQDTVTTITTHAVGTSINASANFQVPFVGSTGVALTSTYNFSVASNNSNSRSVTHTVQPQKVVVPANSSVEVIVMLNKAKITGNVALQGELIGSESGSMTFQGYNLYLGWMDAFYRDYSFTLADMANKYGGNKGSMENGTYFLGIVPNADGSINIEGKGSYEASIGSELTVTVRDLTTGKSVSTELEGQASTDRNTDNAASKVIYSSPESIKIL